MNLRFFHTLFFGVVITVVTGCSDDDNNIVENVVSAITLSEEVIEINEPMGSVSFQGGKTLALEVGVGSGAFHSPNDPVDEFYTITDRGANIACDDSAEVLEVENFCQVTPGTVEKNGKIFPKPSFTPTIYKFDIDTGGVVGSKVGYEVKQTISLRDKEGELINGLPNPLQVTTTENAYDNSGKVLDLDPAGLDPEAIVKLSNDTFWLAEEYAPSLVHVAADGVIFERIVPIGVENDLRNANYKVIGALPAILTKRQLNRGIEALALSPDEQFLYFIMESPLANPNEAAFQNSRYVRLFRISLHTDGNRGDLDSIVDEYVYIMESPQEFTTDDTTKQSDVKISEMVAVDTDKLIILERVTKDTKLYWVSLDNATNIYNTEWDNEATNPSLEMLPDLATQNITPLSKTQIFNSRSDKSDLDSNIEGIALLNDEYVAFLNDNDFGIKGVKTRITVVKIAKIAEMLKQ